jgi:hypothetical protein
MLACVMDNGRMPPLLSTLYVEPDHPGTLVVNAKYTIPHFTNADTPTAKKVGVVTAINNDFDSNKYAEVTVFLAGPQP